MGDASFAQTSFLGGEWSQTAQGRFDSPDYKHALALCQNAVPTEEGAWIRRGGTQYVATTRSGLPARGIEFAFSATAPYSLIFTDNHLTLYNGTVQATDGASVAYDFSTPYGTTPGSWVNVYPVQNELQMVLLHPKYPPRLLTATPRTGAGYDFALTAPQLQNGPYLNINTDATALANAVSGSITLTCSYVAYSATTFYAAGRYVISSAVYYVSLTDTVGDTPATSPTKWAVVNSTSAVNSGRGFLSTDVGRSIQIISGAVYSWGVITSFTTGGTVPGLLSGAIGTTFSNAVGTPNAPSFISPASNAFDGTTSKSSGGAFAVVSSTGSGANGDTITFSLGKNYTGTPRQILQTIVYPATDASFNGNGTLPTVTINLRAKASAPVSSSDGTLLGTSGAVSAKTTTTPVTVSSSDISTAWNYVWVEILFKENNTIQNPNFCRVAQVEFYAAVTGGQGVNVKLYGPALPNTTNTCQYAVGTFSDTTGWPTCGAFHQGRLWLGGSTPNRFDASVANSSAGMFDFSPTTNGTATVTDANAISYTISSQQSNAIFWMEAGLQGIVLGTPGGEILIAAGTSNGVITPTSINVTRVTKFGCANVRPIRTPTTNVFVQRQGRKLLEFLADAYSGKFFGPNLSKFSKHLTNSGISELAYQEELAPVIWMRKSDGTLAGTTYRRSTLLSSQPPDFNAWHRHVLGSGRVIESIWAGASVDGTIQQLSMITSDGTTRWIEIMMPPMDESLTPAQAWLVDGGVTPPIGAEVSTTSITFSGMTHLVGKTVSMTCAGLDLGDRVVSGGGTISVTYGSDPAGLFTRAYVISKNNVLGYNGAATVITMSDASINTIGCTAGFTFTSRGQMLRPAEQPGSGAQNGPAFAKVRRQQMYGALLVNTIGVSFGTIFGKLRSALFRSSGNTPIPVTTAYNGVWWATLEDGYTLDSQIAWEITRPYPCTVAAAGGFINTQDR